VGGVPDDAVEQLRPDGPLDAGGDEDVEEHAAIVAALRSRDGAAAERAVRRHIAASAGYLLAALRGNT
jgi:DNA-binding GntR family transcriptional regulator